MSMSIERIILGTAQLGLDYGFTNRDGKPSKVLASKILQTALDIGIGVLDTAVGYGDSETVIGEISDARFKIISKWMKNPDELGGSLKRLNSGNLFAWLAHRPERILKDTSLWEEMRAQQEAGKVKKIGVSVYGIEEVRKLWNVGIEPEIVQIPVNILDTNALASCFEMREHNVEIHARSIFLQGVLLAEPEDLPSHFDSLKPWLKEVSLNFSSTPSRARALINYVLNEIGVDHVVLGAETSEQVGQWGNHSSRADKSGNLPIPPSSLDKTITNPTLWPSK